MLTSQKMNQLPETAIKQICSFLRIIEINRFASTCKDLNSLVRVKVSRSKHSKTYPKKAFSNVLYLEKDISFNLDFATTFYQLRIIKIIFQTKNSSLVTDTQEESWMEAEFKDSEGKVIQIENQQEPSQQNRIKLLNNFEAANQTTKCCYISQQNLLEKAVKMEVYVRSEKQRQLVSCKNIEIKMFYGQKNMSLQASQAKQYLNNGKKRSLILQ